MMAVKPQHVILYLETYMDLKYKILLSNHNLFCYSNIDYSLPLDGENLTEVNIHLILRYCIIINSPGYK